MNCYSDSIRGEFDISIFSACTFWCHFTIEPNCLALTPRMSKNFCISTRSERLTSTVYSMQWICMIWIVIIWDTCKIVDRFLMNHRWVRWLVEFVFIFRSEESKEPKYFLKKCMVQLNANKVPSFQLIAMARQPGTITKLQIIFNWKSISLCPILPHLATAKKSKKKNSQIKSRFNLTQFVTVHLKWLRLVSSMQPFDLELNINMNNRCSV